jgi:pimeloyl-ACP methyl ester carboxylesterase
MLGVPALYLLADEARSVLGASRGRLIRELPPNAESVEFDSGHTIHRDRFDAYLAEVLRWLGAG